MSDFIKKFIIKASEFHLGVNFDGDNWEKYVDGLDALENFIHTENKSTIFAKIVELNDRKAIEFTNIGDPENTEKTVFFCKTISGILTENNLASIQITSVSGPPTLALYQTLSNVFTPLLKQQNLQRQIANLQADLRSVILSTGSNSDLSVVSYDPLSVVDSLEDEIEYWQNAAQTSKNRLTRSASAVYIEILNPLAQQFKVIDALPLGEAEDLLENGHSVLDDLWRHEPSFPKDRMKHLMDLIASDVCLCIKKQLDLNDIWTENYNFVAELLTQCISLGEKWLTTCKQLTGIFWPNYPTNNWGESIYVPSDLVKFVARLEEILTVQTLHRQLVRLLTSQELESLKTNDMFKPFKELNIFEFGQFSCNLWEKARKQFEYLLQPAEEYVAGKLKKQLAQVNANTRQLLHEFSRYSELISRPIMKQTLLTERQFLLNSLYDYVRQLQSQTTQETPVLSTKYETPQVVAEVILTRQLEAKVMEVHKTGQKLLDDLQGYEKLKQIVIELLHDLKQQHTELFESWTNEISAKIQKLTLRESDAVVAFSKNKLMEVNYSPRLVTLVSEVRQFTALGYHVPSSIEQISEQARKFMHLARTLEQIANFHNTIGDRMIACQKPMMLNSALALSKLVQEQEVVSWGDTKSVQKYVDTLKNAVEKLSHENHLLTSYHHQIIEKINLLKEVDLIKDYNKWRETTKQSRNIMTQVEEKGFKNMQNWKSDVDKNLHDILEKQYIKSLDTLHLYLPEIYTDIVYRQSQLQFSPNEQVLKEKYQQQLKKFLDIPRNFRGVSDSNEMFTQIIERSNLDKVNNHTEGLFEQLKGVIKHWQSWLQVDTLDVAKLSTWQHWDLHFRASKTFGQEIAKLPSNEERVGCFLIGLSRLKSDLESHNRSYWDQLVLSLKDSIAEDVVKLQNYIDPSTATLTRQPVTIEEIGESGVSHANILQQIPEMEECFIQMNHKSQILLSWTREQVDSVNRLKGAWERLQSLLENHQHIIAKQMGTIKTTLNIENENLEKEMERFAAKWEQVKPKPHTGQIADESIEDLNKQLQNIKEKKHLWLELMEKKDKLIADYIRFHFELPTFSMVEDIENDLNKEEGSWSVFEKYYTELNELSNEEWIVFRKKSYRFDDFLSIWQNLLKNEENNDLGRRLLQEIQKYEMIIPSLKYVKGDDFTNKHWMDVFNLLEMPQKSIDTLTFKDFLNVSDKLVDAKSELQLICKKAASEIVVRQALAELDQWDVQARFILTPHADSHDKTIMLVKDYKDILNKVGDNQSLLQSVKNSSDYESFSERASIWETKLANLDQNLTSLAQIQRKWVYLEPIFGGGTLIQEKSRFDKIDKDFHHVLSYIEKDQRVSSLHRYPNLGNLLKNLLDQLSRCQKSLDNFLAEKREKFPRFLFLGDDDLLEVVGQSSKEQVIQTHLKKLFAGVNSIQLDAEGKNIVAICSLHGEDVSLANPVSIKQSVENWLNVLVKQMQFTLKDLLVQCLSEGLSADPLKYPSQILCLADNITFTLKIEQAISSMTLPPLLAYYKAQLNYYSSLELNLEEKSLTTIHPASDDDDDTNTLELKLKALLLDTIHHIQVIEELLNSNITKINDWHWQRQLRFYSNSTGEVTVKMANARMDYAFEYLGNMQKLVRTPLTDRCFLTLSQGMHLGMGGNPYGPAGTGKTESVKALGGFLGRQVLVFNCDEGIDATSMGRILSGLVRSGAWGCFDEFNRLDEATLSAVSMQIHPIQVALRTGQEKLTLLDREIIVDKHCGIFVTLNPAGGSYGGRNKLPDNLKQLFRPVLMTQPDHEQIARTLLLCEGYQNTNVIGKKLIEIFELANRLLSKQQHYDWGLRSIRTILTGCGRALKKCRKDAEMPENTLESELRLVVRVLRMDTMSKLTFSDSVKFELLIKDIFKGITVGDFDNELLTKSLKECFAELKLVPNERQTKKCLELYEQLKQRMGVAIVGPPSCGKTTIRNLLLHALLKMGKILKQHSFNPKSMQKSELLGQIDLDTRQWIDGVLTIYSLQVTSEPSDVWSWIVCDGNIDPEWVESLNSVMDDNRLLSLPSGWRVQFGSNVNFVFETHDLGHASPATVSRMGVVFLSEEDLSLNDYIAHFVKEIPDEELANLITENLLKAVYWIINDGDTTIPCSKLAILQTGLSQLYEIKNKAQLTVAFINGLGQQLQDDFREIYSQQVYEWLEELPPPIITKSRYNADKGIIDTYYTNPNLIIEENCTKIPLVLTGQIYQTLDTLRVWLLPNNEQHFLLIGPHGSGKTLILEYLVRERSDMDLATIYCSANLMPNFIIGKIGQFCISVNTNRGKILKPKRGYLMIHLKNLHLLKPDKWGTNKIIEFLHQIITYNAFFDANLELIGVENVIIVGSLSGTPTLSSRFTSILHFYNVNAPDQEDFSIIIIGFLSNLIKNNFDLNWPKAKTVKLAGSIITIYEKIRGAFVPNQHKHYVFSPHDVTNWCASLLNYKNNLDDNTIVEIFCYEALRQFGDRLVNDEDRTKLAFIINETFKTYGGNSNLLKNAQNIFYIPLGGNLLKLGRIEWGDLVQKGITQFERDGQNLDLLINEELLQLTASLAKILNQPEGNAVLIGRSGIGRKSSVKIVSALQSAKLITPIVDQFNNDLKIAIQLAGLEGEQVYVIVEDQILQQPATLSLINLLICSGEVPQLYNSAEYDSLVAGLKDEANRENYDGNLLQFFNERVKKNLHVVVCIDVDDEHIWEILENCPAFLHNSAIIWKTEWSTETITNIPTMLINQWNENKKRSVEIQTSTAFVDIFEIVKSSIAAPSRFITMIRLYIDIFIEKKTEILGKQGKLEAGVAKLIEAGESVLALRKKAAQQQERLAEKQAKANVALDMISTTMKNANSHKEEMESLKSKTEQENQQLMIRKKEIEEELSEVEPLIREARSAVGNIKTESLSEIRSLRAPPEVIRDILEGVLRLMGIQDTSWNSMKIFLAKRGVKEEIKSFDATRITTENRKTVERLMTNKGDSFDPKSAKRASVAAAPLAAWVIANVKYSHVLDKIKPLEREQNKLKQNLNDAETQLGELSAGLTNVDTVVAKLKNQLSAFTKEAAEIEIDLTKAQETLAAAEGLVSKLNDEFGRWQEQLKALSGQIAKLPNNCALAAAFINYLSDESEIERRNILDKWLRAVSTTDFSFEQFLSSEREQLQWQTEGLPSDKLSVQNAIVILKAKIAPLLVDPTSCAINWIKNHMKMRQIECCTQNSPKFNTNLELSIRFGKIFVVEEVEKISPVLLSILRKEFVYQGERKLIKLGGKLIDYHNDFYLVLCSRNEQLKLDADVAAIISTINFTVTHAGLTEKLLSYAIHQENPQLEDRRKQLLREREELQEKQYHLQNQLLEDLANSTGNILQNTNLLASLNKTKASSTAISSALEESVEIQKKLQLEYEMYQEISSFGSSLYFACNEFSKFNVLYVLSVSAFIKLFLKSLQTFQGLESTPEFQKKHLFQTIFIHLSRGIFKTDRLMFAMHLKQQLFPSSSEEWAVFLGNSIPRGEPSELPIWIPKHARFHLQNLQVTLPELYDNLQLKEQSIWSAFMNSDNCEEKFPAHCKIGDFQKLLIVQALRPDRTFSCMEQCTVRVAGLKSIDPPLCDLDQIFRESTSSEPILLLTTSGTDPSTEIRELAQNVHANNYLEVAMGEGQEIKALKALDEAAKSGKWLILKNLHLVTKWLNILTQNLQNLQATDNFRLWLITEPNQEFNFVLAQNSLKVVYEVPQGLKNNLQRTYTSFGSKYFEKLSTVSSRIFFVLAYIHGILQERRKYIPQGWSKFYEFSDNDFSTCIKLIEDLWQVHSPKVPWTFIFGLCCDAVYGGRIENYDDMEVLKSYLRQFLEDDVLSHRWTPMTKVALPNSSKFQEYINAVKQFPNRDSPTYFGLPDNIDRAWQKQTAAEIVAKLKSLSLVKTVSTAFDREYWCRNLTPYMNMWKKLNQGMDLVRMNPPEISGNSSVEIFFSEEIHNAISLVQLIHKNFASLNRVLKGVSLPDETNLLIGYNLMNHQIPKIWAVHWEGPGDPSKYLRCVVGKTSNLLKFKVEITRIYEKSINLSMLFRPNTFLASVKQDCSRMNNIAMDELDLETNWKRPITNNYIILSELLIEGGLFDGNNLSACLPHSDNINPAPNCFISWKENKSLIKEDQYLDVPVYYTSNREQQFGKLQIVCNLKEKDRWIRAGLAFYLDY